MATSSSSGGHGSGSALLPRSARAQMEEVMGKLDITDEEATPLVLDDDEDGAQPTKVASGEEDSLSESLPYPDNLQCFTAHVGTP